MIEIFLAIALLIAFTILLSLYRAVLGPGVFNHVAVVSVIGTKTIVLLITAIARFLHATGMPQGSAIRLHIFKLFLSFSPIQQQHMR